MKNHLNTTIKLIVLLMVFILPISKTEGQISKRIDSLAREHVKKGFNGNILYSKNDSIIFTGNYGYRDFSTKQSLNDSTLFELASNSKQFTALAIVQLVEKNLINYETKIVEIFRDFPYKTITIKHLLKHQSGLPDNQKMLYNKKFWNRKKVATNQDLLNLLAKHKIELSFVPGTRYDYNNTGYAVLASIIEELSGLTFYQYLKKNIFDLIGMNSTTAEAIYLKKSNPINVTNGYTFNKKKNKYQNVENDKNHKHIHWMNNINGDSGIYASILDLVKWKNALRNHTLISKESYEHMIATDTISKKYGYGFAIYKTKNKGKWLYHSGSWTGYKTSTIYLPKTNEYLVILSNNRYVETYKKMEADLYKLIQ